MTLLGQAMAQSFVAELARPGGEQPVGRLRSRMAVLAAASTVALLPVMVAGPQLAEWLFGATWRDAGRFAQLLSPGFVAQLAVSPFAPMLVARGVARWQLWWDASRVVVVVAALAVPAGLGLGVEAAAAALGVGLAGMYVVLGGAVLRAAARPATAAAPAHVQLASSRS
jgi:O-antigen/teichoic acid export membrane protein